MPRRTRTNIALITLAATLLTGAPNPGAQALVSPVVKPFAGRLSPDIEPYAAYDGQTKCSYKAKPGVVAFERHVLRRFAVRSYGITRGCVKGAVSEHYEGRAIDWHMNAYNPADKERVKKLFRWLFKTDWWGNTHARARRLGIMYIIWNKRMWRAYRPTAGWQKYEGSSPHTDHVHISFARAGGLGITSFWSGKVADLPGAWIPGPTPTPTPKPTPSPTPKPTPSPTGSASPTPNPWPTPSWTPIPWPTWHR